MTTATITRRALIRSIGLVALAGSAVLACGPGPLQRPPTGSRLFATQATPVGAKIDLAVAVWTDPARTWMKKYAGEWATRHPEVNLTIDAIPYAEMATTQLAELAARTLQDVSYNSVEWLGYNLYKGAFMPLDDVMKVQDPYLEDYIPLAFPPAMWEGKLFALPSAVTTGNTNIVVYNRDLVEARGAKPPTDAWTTADYVNWIAKLTDATGEVQGTDYFPGATYYDFGALLRSFDAEILSDDGIKFLFDQPRSIELATWARSLGTQPVTAPGRPEAAQASFLAGKVAFHAASLQETIGLTAAIGGRFRWDAVLPPTGSDGHRGFDSLVLNWAISARTKFPFIAYDLLLALTALEVQTWAFANEGQPPARQALWARDAAIRINPIWRRALTWITNGVDNGRLPLPNNLRFAELEAAWERSAHGIFTGAVPIADGVKQAEAACQAVMELPPV